MAMPGCWLLVVDVSPRLFTFFIFSFPIDYSVLSDHFQQWLDSFFAWINIISKNALLSDNFMEPKKTFL
jgi:hypothetical protein